MFKRITNLWSTSKENTLSASGSSAGTQEKKEKKQASKALKQHYDWELVGLPVDSKHPEQRYGLKIEASDYNEPSIMAEYYEKIAKGIFYTNWHQQSQRRGNEQALSWIQSLPNCSLLDLFQQFKKSLEGFTNVQQEMLTDTFKKTLQTDIETRKKHEKTIDNIHQKLSQNGLNGITSDDLSELAQIEQLIQANTLSLAESNVQAYYQTRILISEQYKDLLNQIEFWNQWIDKLNIQNFIVSPKINFWGAVLKWGEDARQVSYNTPAYEQFKLIYKKTLMNSLKPICQSYEERLKQIDISLSRCVNDILPDLNEAPAAVMDSSIVNEQEKLKSMAKIEEARQKILEKQASFKPNPNDSQLPESEITTYIPKDNTFDSLYSSADISLGNNSDDVQEAPPEDDDTYYQDEQKLQEDEDLQFDIEVTLPEGANDLRQGDKLQICPNSIVSAPISDNTLDVNIQTSFKSAPLEEINSDRPKQKAHSLVLQETTHFSDVMQPKKAQSEPINVTQLSSITAPSSVKEEKIENIDVIFNALTSINAQCAEKLKTFFDDCVTFMQTSLSEIDKTHTFLNRLSTIKNDIEARKYPCLEKLIVDDLGKVMDVIEGKCHEKLKAQVTKKLKDLSGKNNPINYTKLYTSFINTTIKTCKNSEEFSAYFEILKTVKSVYEQKDLISDKFLTQVMKNIFKPYQELENLPLSKKYTAEMKKLIDKVSQAESVENIDTPNSQRSDEHYDPMIHKQDIFLSEKVRSYSQQISTFEDRKKAIDKLLEYCDLEERFHKTNPLLLKTAQALEFSFSHLKDNIIDNIHAQGPVSLPNIKNAMLDIVGVAHTNFALARLLIPSETLISFRKTLAAKKEALNMEREKLSKNIEELNRHLQITSNQKSVFDTLKEVIDDLGIYFLTSNTDSAPEDSLTASELEALKKSFKAETQYSSTKVNTCEFFETLNDFYNKVESEKVHDKTYSDLVVHLQNINPQLTINSSASDIEYTINNQLKETINAFNESFNMSLNQAHIQKDKMIEEFQKLSNENVEPLRLDNVEELLIDEHTNINGLETKFKAEATTFSELSRQFEKAPNLNEKREALEQVKSAKRREEEAIVAYNNFCVSLPQKFQARKAERLTLITQAKNTLNAFIVPNRLLETDLLENSRQIYNEAYKRLSEALQSKDAVLKQHDIEHASRQDQEKWINTANEQIKNITDLHNRVIDLHAILKPEQAKAPVAQDVDDSTSQRKYRIFVAGALVSVGHVGLALVGYGAFMVFAPPVAAAVMVAHGVILASSIAASVYIDRKNRQSLAHDPKKPKNVFEQHSDASMVERLEVPNDQAPKVNITSTSLDADQQMKQEKPTTQQKSPSVFLSTLAVCGVGGALAVGLGLAAVGGFLLGGPVGAGLAIAGVLAAAAGVFGLTGLGIGFFHFSHPVSKEKTIVSEEGFNNSLGIPQTS
jgi:cell division protein FtsL